VVGEADGHAAQSAIRNAATRAVTRDAAEREAIERRPVATGDAAPARQTSADLTGLLEQLRTAVVCYVGERREAGAPIQRVLPEVKALVREAVAYEGWHDPAAALMPQVVGWTIAAFYDAPAPRQPSPERQERQEAAHVAGRR
jgi:hypothetical protein